jgi:hypothetical protein
MKLGKAATKKSNRDNKGNMSRGLAFLQSPAGGEVAQANR